MRSAHNVSHAEHDQRHSSQSSLTRAIRDNVVRELVVTEVLNTEQVFVFIYLHNI